MNEAQEKPTEFDLYAGEYDDLIRDPIREKFASSNRFFAERKLQVIHRFYGNRNTDTRALNWLDVGCGQGDLLRMGKSRFASVAGCDPSSGMLRSCSGLQIRLQTSAELLPFDDGSFDFITAVCVYHHVPVEQRETLCREAFRLLRRGGVFCLIEHNPLNPVTRLIVSRTPVDANAQLLTAGSSRRLMTRAGGRILKTRYFLLFPEQIYKRLARVEDWMQAVPLAGQYAVFAERAN